VDRSSERAPGLLTEKRIPRKEFPWRCGQCGRTEVFPARTTYTARIRHDGRLHEFTIPALRIPTCRACGERVFTEDVDEQINESLREHLGLLSPDQIRESIRRLGISQKELSQGLGIAEATISRWVNGVQIQSKAMDVLLRVYFAFPDVRGAIGPSGPDAKLGVDCSVR
jgi:putative zinc finger/helix-turn-helix YgiT family protein